jgi:hypothetical protein
MKQFASWFTHAIPYGAALRKSIFESQTESEVMDRIEEFFRTALVASQEDPELNVA